MDEVWKREELDSPCKKICVIDPESRFCIGCFRTISEISNWSNYTDVVRNELKETLKIRARKLQPRRKGGRKSRIRSTN